MADNGAQAIRYLAEVYTPRRELAELEVNAERVRVAADALAAEGVPVRHVQVVFVPNEETCFHLFEAADPGAVEQVLRQVGLEAERISPAFDPSRFTG